MSTSVVSHGTIEQQRQAGESTPETWAVGDVLLPLGGAKGTGLALVVDVLAGILSGAGFSGAAAAADDQGVWILTLDPTRFLPPGRLDADVERLAQYVRSAPPTSPGVEVLVPGEHGALAAHEAALAGVTVPRRLWEDLVTRARFEDVHVPTPMTEELP
jgi:LDH2 family malate/lactate/ureidoglycolate dehydrogenase